MEIQAGGECNKSESKYFFFLYRAVGGEKESKREQQAGKRASGKARGERERAAVTVTQQSGCL